MVLQKAEGIAALLLGSSVDAEQSEAFAAADSVSVPCLFPGIILCPQGSVVLQCAHS